MDIHVFFKELDLLTSKCCEISKQLYELRLHANMISYSEETTVKLLNLQLTLSRAIDVILEFDKGQQLMDFIGNTMLHGNNEYISDIVLLSFCLPTELESYMTHYVDRIKNRTHFLTQCPGVTEFAKDSLAKVCYLPIHLLTMIWDYLEGDVSIMFVPQTSIFFKIDFEGDDTVLKIYGPEVLSLTHGLQHPLRDILIEYFTNAEIQKKYESNKIYNAQLAIINENPKKYI